MNDHEQWDHALPNSLLIVLRARSAFGFALAVILGGCAQNASAPHSDFERLEIIVLASENAADEIPSKGKSAATGAAGGALGGLMVSFLGSLVCGPAFAICFAAIAPATVGGTALVGGVMGAGGISTAEAEKIIPYLEAQQTGDILSQKLAASVSRQLPANGAALSEGADARLSLKINSVLVVRGFGEKVSLLLPVDAQFDWNLNMPSPKHSSRAYRCQTPVLPLDEWASNNGALVEKELNLCIEDIALQINKALTEPLAVPDVGFSEIDT